LRDVQKHRQELLDKTTKEYYEMGAKREEIKKALDDLRET
jgi:hypothetical protein